MYRYGESSRLFVKVPHVAFQIASLFEPPGTQFTPKRIFTSVLKNVRPQRLLQQERPETDHASMRLLTHVPHYVCLQRVFVLEAFTAIIARVICFV